MKFECNRPYIVKYQQALARDTPLAAKWRLVVEYARDNGGLTLDYWEMKMGPLFGKPSRAGTADCARELGVPVSDLAEIATRTWEWVDNRMETNTP